MSWTTLLVNDQNPIKRNIYGFESQFDVNVGVGTNIANRITFNGLNGEGNIPHINALDANITSIVCDSLTIRGQTGATGAYFVETNDEALLDNFVVVGGVTGATGQVVKMDTKLYHGDTGLYVGSANTDKIIASGTNSAISALVGDQLVGQYRHAYVRQQYLPSAKYITSGGISNIVKEGTGIYLVSLGTSGVTADKIFATASVVSDSNLGGGATNNDAVCNPEFLDDQVRFRILTTTGTYKDYPWNGQISYRCDNL